MQVLERGEFHLGMLTATDWIVAPDGAAYKGFYGWLRLLTDGELGKGFRSTEKWQAAVYAEPNGAVACLVPGCKVLGVVLGQLEGGKLPSVYDCTKAGPFRSQ